jgi:peptide/nickel transport system substrate-binding protein
VQRRVKKDPVAQGGWSAIGTFWSGLDLASPASNPFLRAAGETGAYGWPKSDALEALRQQWLDAPDVAAQKRLAVDIQKQALVDLPYVPLGQYFYATAYQPNVTGVLDGLVVFWNVRKT